MVQTKWFIFTYKESNRESPTQFENGIKPRVHVMPQSHTHLRTLRMIRKAHPHRSVHSVTIRNYTYLIRRHRNSSYLPQDPFHPRPNFEKYQKSSADEQNAIIRNSRHSDVSIRISSVTKRIKTYRSANDPELRTNTVLFGSLHLVTVSYYLIQRIVTDGYFRKRFHTESLRSNTDRYLFMQIVVESCE